MQADISMLTPVTQARPASMADARAYIYVAREQFGEAPEHASDPAFWRSLRRVFAGAVQRVLVIEARGAFAAVAVDVDGTGVTLPEAPASTASAFPLPPPDPVGDLVVTYVATGQPVSAQEMDWGAITAWAAAAPTPAGEPRLVSGA